MARHYSTIVLPVQLKLSIKLPVLQQEHYLQLQTIIMQLIGMY